MRRDSPTGQNQPRTQEFMPHNVPPKAKTHGHIALFFQSEADRTFKPDATGRQLAAELTRSLRPAHRALLFGTS